MSIPTRMRPPAARGRMSTATAFAREDAVAWLVHHCSRRAKPLVVATLARAWGWRSDRVERFLAELEAKHLIQIMTAPDGRRYIAYPVPGQRVALPKAARRAAGRKTAPKRAAGIVYVATSRDAASYRLKIGFTAHPETRLRTYSSGSATHDMHVLVEHRHAFQIEQLLHWILREFRDTSDPAHRECYAFPSWCGAEEIRIILLKARAGARLRAAPDP